MEVYDVRFWVNMEPLDFHQIVLQFEFSLFNDYGYEEFKEKLLAAEDWAFNNAKLLEKTEKYNVKDIYKQFYEFERCIEICKPQTVTKTREEAIIFALLQYANENRPIIAATFTERENQRVMSATLRTLKYNPETERIKSIQGRKLTALASLLAFYMGKSKSDEACFNALNKTFLAKITTEIRLNKYSDYDIYEISKLDKLPNRYDGGSVIHYLKILIKHNDYETAKRMFDLYPVQPRNKKDTADYDRIKLKLGK